MSPATSSYFYSWVISLAVGLCALLIIGFLYRLATDVPHSGESLPDPPPSWFRPIWWLVLIAAFYSAPWMSWRSRRAIEKRLTEAGLHHALRAKHLFGAQWLLGIALAGIMVAVVETLSRGASPTALCGVASVGAIGGAAMPRLWLRDQILQRKREVVRALPFLLDMTTLCVEAGLNFSSALQQAARKGPAGPLRDELQRVLGDIRTGAPRAQALRDMANRINEPAVRSLVGTLIQADTLGMNLAQVLRAQSDQRRAERFLQAEKLAMEAPVKMLFPLIVFIFPCTFVVIAFPIAMKLLDLIG